MKVKKITAFGLAALLTASMIGCGGSGAGGSKTGKETKGSAVKNSKDVTKITIYPGDANLTSGVVSGWRKDLFAKEGLQIDVWAYSEDKTNAILASGDLPDLMLVNGKNFDTMVGSDMLLDLDDYLDQIPHFKKIKESDEVVNYMKKYRSNGKNKMYGIPNSIGAGDYRRDTERYGLRLFWDYYEDVGAPKFSNLDELIPILKEIQEKHPKDQDGNKAYAVGTYYDPVNFTYYYGYSTLFGHAPNFLNLMVDEDMVNEKCSYLLAGDGMFHDCLKWYNKLYKDGLLDPNSINLDRNTHQGYIDKDVGTYYMTMMESPGWDPFYYQAYFDGEKIYYHNYSELGNEPYWVINKNTKHKDACLKFLEMISDPNKYIQIRDGVPGEYWAVKDGTKETYLTDKALDCIKNKKEFIYSDGEQKDIWNTSYINGMGAMTDYVDAKGSPRVCRADQWEEAMDLAEQNSTFDAWKKTNGYNNWVDLLKDKKALYTDSAYDNVGRFMEQLSNKEQLVQNSVVSAVNEAAWKMIYAKSEDEFNKLWDTMTEKAEKLGAKTLYNTTVKRIDEAMKLKEELNK